MILDQIVSRDVERLFRHKKGDEGHHAEVRFFKRLHLFPDFWVLIGGRLEYREALFLGCDLEGVRLTLVWRYIDTDDVFVAFDELLKDRLSEGLLAVHDETHVEFLPLQKLFVIQLEGFGHFYTERRALLPDPLCQCGRNRCYRNAIRRN